MNWQPISTYPCEPWEQGPDAILYDEEEGIKPGRGDKYCFDEDPNDPYHQTKFRTWGCCGNSLDNVTHWMPMPTVKPTAPVERQHPEQCNGCGQCS